MLFRLAGWGFLPAALLGAVLFGYLGDKLGRKYTFLVTVTLMGVATAGVGLIPAGGGCKEFAVRAADLFGLLARVGNANAAGEYYLVEIVNVANAEGRSCAVVVTDGRLNPAEHKKFVEAEIAKWGPAIKAAGQYAD